MCCRSFLSSTSDDKYRPGLLFGCVCVCLYSTLEHPAESNGSSLLTITGFGFPRAGFFLFQQPSFSPFGFGKLNETTHQLSWRRMYNWGFPNRRWRRRRHRHRFDGWLTRFVNIKGPTGMSWVEDLMAPGSVSPRIVSNFLIAIADCAWFGQLRIRFFDVARL